jgi:urease accessory protein
MPLNVRLLQLADSALPISGYTHSWGLETAIARGLVTGPELLEQWTAQWLRSSLGPLEGVVVAHSCRFAQHKAFSELLQMNKLMEVSVMPPTIRRASREMGEQLLALSATWIWSEAAVAPFVTRGTGGWHHPVVFGLLGALAGAAVDEVLTAYLHQSALGMVSAGVCAIPVGHTHGQQIVAYLQDVIMELVQDLGERGLDTIGAGCPQYEVMCDEKTRLYTRMFRS